MRELELLGRVEFAVPREGDAVRGRRFVDPSGRVWISTWMTASIHVFDSSGKALFTCTPDAGDDLRYKPYWWFDLTPQGHLLAGTRDKLVEFDAEGRRVACSALPREALRFHYLPLDEGHWELGDRDLTFVSADLARRAVREPKTEDREFRRASMATDGALAVCEEGPSGGGIAPSKFEPALHVFARGGDHLWTLDLPYEGSVSDMTFDDRGVTLLANIGGPSSCSLQGSFPPWDIWTVSKDGAHVARARLPHPLPELAYLALSPSGDELWVFPSEEPALYRFARP